MSAHGSSPSKPPPPDRLAFLGTWGWRQPDPAETTAEWMTRTARLRRQLLENTSWLRPGESVRVHAERSIAGVFAGRVGTVHRLCGETFSDFVYVRFLLAGRERVERTVMLPLEVLERAEVAS